MQEFKIEHYINEMPGNVFPEFYALNQEECREVVNEIKTIVPGAGDYGNIFKGIQAACKSAPSTDEELDEIGNVFEALGFSCSDELYLVWDEEQIDKMRIDLFLEHWKDMWYPPSDEVVICYCRSTGKFVMITDWGQVFVN